MSKTTIRHGTPAEPWLVAEVDLAAQLTTDPAGNPEASFLVTLQPGTQLGTHYVDRIGEAPQSMIRRLAEPATVRVRVSPDFLARLALRALRNRTGKAKAGALTARRIYHTHKTTTEPSR